MIRTLTITTTGRGLTEITGSVAAVAAQALASGRMGPEGDGLCTVFVKHTSASVVIQENADAAVRADLEAWMARLVRDGDPAFTHVEEGPDDMPSHIRAALTAVSVAIPIEKGRLALGRWQGIYLWEHRAEGRARSVVVHVGA